MSVKEIVAAVSVGQSTVSQHLRQLAAVGFVLAEERRHLPAVPDQPSCVAAFPTAADVVLGQPAPDPVGRLTCGSSR